MYNFISLVILLPIPVKQTFISLQNIRYQKHFKKHNFSLIMPPSSPEVTEFFGVFIAYTEIIEKSRLFGKCPFHWNYDGNRLTVDSRFFPYCKFWIKIGIAILSVIIPTVTVLLRYLNSKLSAGEKEEVPLGVISIYSSVILLLIGVVVILMPIIVLWDRYAVDEIDRSFKIFLSLSEGKLR